MNAHALADAGKPTVRIRGRQYPILLPSLARPAAAPRGRDHLAAGARAGRLRVPPLDRADPRRARHLRGARVRHRVPAPARASCGRRARCSPATASRSSCASRARSTATGGASTAGGSSPAPRPCRCSRSTSSASAAGTSSTRRTSGSCCASCARARPRRAARLLVGRRCRGWLLLALVIIVGGGARDPLAAAPARHRRHVLARRSRPAIGVLALSGHAMTARWHLGPGHRRLLLVGARHLARDPRLPLLHDHRPEDDPERALAAARLRGRHRRCSRRC